MADLDTALLRAFVALAETLSFSRTAGRVGRSQSAVSMQIAKLEETLGCRLFERDKRNVAITAEGEALLGDARRILGLAEAMVARNRANDVAGEVRFASPEDFATQYLPAILAAFADRHPQVRLHVTCDLTLRLVESFGRGEQDLIVVKQDPADPYPGSRPLWRELPVFVGRGRQPVQWIGDILVRDDAGAALSAKAVLKPTKGFHAARHRSTLYELGEALLGRPLLGGVDEISDLLPGSLAELPILSAQVDLRHFAIECGLAGGLVLRPE